jgi:hypothetical protein
MQQEELLQSIKEELKRIRKQLTTIEQLLEELSKRNDKKKVVTSKSTRPSLSPINKAPKEARRITRSWSEKQTHQEKCEHFARQNEFCYRRCAYQTQINCSAV